MSTYSGSQPQPSSRSSRTFDSVNKYNQISDVIQTHVKQVYLLVCFALIASAFGASLRLVWNIGVVFTCLLTWGSMFWFFATASHKKKRRVLILLLFSVLHGASLAPLIDLAIDVNPSTLVSAFMATAIVSACFSGVATLARGRVSLYLGGFISSCFSFVLWIIIAALMFGESGELFIIETFFGILVFVGFMVFDTQVMIKRALAGNPDYVRDAFLLSTDFVSVFARMLFFLLKGSIKKEENKEKTCD